MKEVKEEIKNFVLVIKYECGESAYLTNEPDLLSALTEYVENRNKLMTSQAKDFALPQIREAKLYRLYK